MSLINKTLRILSLAALGLVASVAAQADDELHLDQAPLRFDNASLQHGAKLFINYCVSCHSASSLRYNRLEQIGLTDAQIKDKLMFTADKVGEQMTVALRRQDAKVWFGVAPPDLTLIARALASESGSGPDWLYTYLRQFYRDDSRPTGWNNVVFPNVGMPNVLWELQGEQVAHVVEKVDDQGNKTSHIDSLEIVKPGQLSKDEYDEDITDLVSFMTWMSEPDQGIRTTIGWFVLAVLAVLAVLTYLLKRAIWKDVH